MILTPLQILPKNVGDLGKFIVAKCFEWLPKVQKIAQSGHTAGDQPYSDTSSSSCKCSLPEDEDNVTRWENKMGPKQASCYYFIFFLGYLELSQTCVWHWPKMFSWRRWAHPWHKKTWKNVKIIYLWIIMNILVVGDEEKEMNFYLHNISITLQTMLAQIWIMILKIWIFVRQASRSMVGRWGDDGSETFVFCFFSVTRFCEISPLW